MGSPRYCGHMPAMTQNSDDTVRMKSERFIRTLEGLLSDGYPSFADAKKICFVDPDVTASAAMILSEYANDCGKIPVPLIKGANIPKWVDGETCAVVASYYSDSETVRCLEELMKRNAKIVCISVRGEASQFCDDNDIHFIELHENLTLQEAVGSIVVIVSYILQGSGVCDSRDSAVKAVSSLKKRLTLPRRTRKEMSSIISSIPGKNILLISLSDLRGAAAVWKNHLSSVTGEPIFSTELPEYDHNEIVGWCNENTDADNMLAVVIHNHSIHLLDVIVESATDVVGDCGRDILTVRIDGSDTIERNLYCIMMSYQFTEAGQ